MLVKATQLINSSVDIEPELFSLFLYEEAAIEQGYYQKGDLWYDTLGRSVAYSAKEVCINNELTYKEVPYKNLYIVHGDVAKELADNGQFVKEFNGVNVWVHNSRSYSVDRVIDMDNTLTQRRMGF